MSSESDPASSQKKCKIDRIIADVKSAIKAWERVDARSLMAAHQDLMPELLEVLKAIEGKRPAPSEPAEETLVRPLQNVSNLASEATMNRPMGNRYDQCRTGIRFGIAIDHPTWDIGFRIVMDIPQ